MSRINGLTLLAETEHVELMYQPGDWSGPELWLTFGSYQNSDAPCSGFITRRNAPAFHFISRTDDWYQDDSIKSLFDIVRSRLGDFRGRVVAFGVSMGAFAAIAYSADLKPDVVVAGSPQIIVDDELSVGRDDRWRSRWTALARSRTLSRVDARSGLASGSIIYCFRDPFETEDRWQTDHLKTFSNVRMVNLPFAGHALFVELINAHQYVDVLNRAVTVSGRGVSSAIAEFNRERRTRLSYWYGLGMSLLKHRHWSAAEMTLRFAKSRWPDHTPLEFHRTVALEKLGRLDEARLVCVHLLETETNDAFRETIAQRLRVLSIEPVAPTPSLQSSPVKVGATATPRQPLPRGLQEIDWDAVRARQSARQSSRSSRLLPRWTGFGKPRGSPE